MQYEPRFDIFSLFMLIGLSQGILITYIFLIRKIKNNHSRLFSGLFMATLVIIASEILLNYSGLIVKVLPIENYSEPFVFLLTPLIYLFIKAELGDKYTARDHVHFFPFIFYFLYTILYFIQPVEFKYNSYVYCYQVGWEYIDFIKSIPDDPLGLRQALAPLYISQFIIYLYLIFWRIYSEAKSGSKGRFSLANEKLRRLFFYWVHTLLATLLIIYVKTSFERDLGDYIIGTYISVLLYFSGFVIISKQISQRKTETITIDPRPKYEKSALSEEQKDKLLEKIIFQLEEKKYHIRNTVSLKGLSVLVDAPAHHVSQVINEKLQKSFFDMIGSYRVKEAAGILKSDSGRKFTIEEIAEQVGYNSKASFNKAFKAFAGQTPSEFRDSHTDSQ